MQEKKPPEHQFTLRVCARASSIAELQRAGAQLAPLPRPSTGWSNTRRFGDFTAVDRVSFTIERGEIFGFVGSNGSGKTTTMKMLTGLLEPSEGEALLFGKPFNATDMSSRKRVGYMSQSFSLYTELTVRQDLSLHAKLFHLPAETARKRIAELVRRFGLEEYLDQRALNLPLGKIPTTVDLVAVVVARTAMQSLASAAGKGQGQQHFQRGVDRERVVAERLAVSVL